MGTAIAIILAVLIHVVWVVRSYTHTSVETAKKVRAFASIMSLLLTIALFVLGQQAVADLAMLYGPTCSVAAEHYSR